MEVAVVIYKGIAPIFIYKVFSPKQVISILVLDTHE